MIQSLEMGNCPGVVGVGPAEPRRPEQTAARVSGREDAAVMGVGSGGTLTSQEPWMAAGSWDRDRFPQVP